MTAAVRVPVLAGPTASGKTGVALELADGLASERAGGVRVEVVSADAMMVYRGMDVGTAKPSALERARVVHHLVDVVDPDESFSVVRYVELAERAIGEVLARGAVPLVVGGTGFYVRGLSEGLPTVPPADARVQEALWRRVEGEGLRALEEELDAVSAADRARAAGNPRRVVRALEIIQRTGRPPSDFPLTKPAFSFAKVVLETDSDGLEERIRRRTGAMFEAGLVEEVRRLLARFPEQPTALQAIGYKEVAAFVRGEVPLEEARGNVERATLQYAKRQRTWFRKEPGAERVGTLGEASERVRQLVLEAAGRR